MTLKELEQELKKLRDKQDDCCPNCGRCPHCGRSAAPAVTVPVLWYVRPWRWGIEPPTYPYGTTGTATFTFPPVTTNTNAIGPAQNMVAT